MKFWLTIAAVVGMLLIAVWVARAADNYALAKEIEMRHNFDKLQLALLDYANSLDAFANSVNLDPLVWPLEKTTTEAERWKNLAAAREKLYNCEGWISTRKVK